MTTDQLVEWVSLERQCCPFFRFQILWEPQNGPVWLCLTGPKGVKDFILDEFGSISISDTDEITRQNRA
jgi:hypothetical protein